MAKEAFITKKFTAPSLIRIEQINAILEEYRRQGYRLSLRQLYYQLVARALIENSQKSYKNIGSLVSDARQAGLIDWAMLEDRGRNTSAAAHWTSVSAILSACASQYKIDKWKAQRYHIEVMVEKDALSGVLEPVCRELDIAITANKGYSSSSTMYDIGKRLAAHQKAGKQLCIIYLGDHDPSGIDMTRDVDERLTMFARTGKIEVVRVALNYAQVEDWQPPENPAKETDSRFEAYQAEFGDSSWELDAVEPRTLADLVRKAVWERRDETLWGEALKQEETERQALKLMADSWDDDNDNLRAFIGLEDADDEEDE